MGNCLRSSHGCTVHPVEQDGKESSFRAAGKNKVRIKVRMSKKQLEEFIAEVNFSKGTSELGRVIYQHCLEGRLSARVIGREALQMPLTSMNEEETEDRVNPPTEITGTEVSSVLFRQLPQKR